MVALLSQNLHQVTISCHEGSKREAGTVMMLLK